MIKSDIFMVVENVGDGGDKLKVLREEPNHGVVDGVFGDWVERELRRILLRLILDVDEHREDAEVAGDEEREVVGGQQVREEHLEGREGHLARQVVIVKILDYAGRSD